MPLLRDTSVDTDPPGLRSLDDLPGPKGIPWLGNALQIEAERAHRQFADWARQYGSIYQLALPGRRVVVVADHEVVTAVLRDRPEGFRRSPRMFEIWSEMGLPEGVFGADGEQWQRQRRMVMAAFDPAHVRRYVPSMLAVADRLAARWARAADTGATIDLQADLMRFTVDVIAGLAFGAEIDTLGSDKDVIQQHLDKIFPMVFKRILAPIPWWRIVRSSSDRQIEHSVREVLAAVEGFVAGARARLASDPGLRERPGNLLEAMLVAADLPDSGIDDRQVAGNVVTMLLAGEDTTANTLAWLIHLLWRHPDCLARAIDEVRAAGADDGALDLARLARLDYLEACAHEAMRLKPVAPFQALQALRDATIGDVRVPAGVIVFVLQGHDAVDDRFLPEAGAFRPERWLGEEDPAARALRGMQSPNRLSMPFGAGPRICPGRYLALLEIKIAMATLLGRFDIVGVDAPDGGEAKERLAFTMSPVGLTLRVRKRADAA